MRALCVLLALLCASAQLDEEADGTGEWDEGGVGEALPLPSCTFLSKGMRFSLDGMKRRDHDYTGTTPGGYTYRFNVCGGSVKVCNSQVAPASKWRGSKCNNLGDMSTQTMELLDASNPKKGLRVAYKNGDICKKQVAIPSDLLSIPHASSPCPPVLSSTIGNFDPSLLRVTPDRWRSHLARCERRRAAPDTMSCAPALALLWMRPPSRCPPVQVNYEIECSRDDPAVLKHIDEVSMCEYTVTFSSKYGCPVGEFNVNFPLHPTSDHRSFA